MESILLQYADPPGHASDSAPRRFTVLNRTESFITVEISNRVLVLQLEPDGMPYDVDSKIWYQELANA